MLVTKKILTKILKALAPTILTRSWSNVTPMSGGSKTLASFTLQKNSKYLILGMNGNNVASAALNSIEFSCAGAPTLIRGGSGSNDTSGNFAIGWCYVETGSANRTFNVASYGYPASISAGAKFVGTAIAIPLMGGVIKSLIFKAFNLSTSERGWAVC